MAIKSFKMKMSASLLILLVGFTSLLLLPQTVAPPTWGFSINPLSRTVQQGGTTQFTVHVMGTSPKPIILFYSPPEIGVSVTFSADIGNPPYSSIMTVHVDPSKPIGSYTLFISAFPQGDTYPGPTVQDTTVILNVVAIPFDFTLTLSPPIEEVEQGEIAQYNIMLSYSDPSFSGTVITYQVTGLGPGMNWIPSGGGLIRISTSPATPPTSYLITVIGSALGVTRQTTATLIVTEPPEEPTPTETFTETVTETPIETPTETPEDEEERLREEEEQRLLEEEERRRQEEEEQRMREEEERRQQEEELRIQQEEEREQRLLMYLIIGILAVVIIVLVIALMRRRSPPPQRVQAPIQRCSNCGEPLTPGKAFCASCGEKIER